MSIFDEKRAKQATCEHENLEDHRGWLTGEPSKHCLDCDIHIFYYEDDYDPDEDGE